MIERWVVVPACLVVVWAGVSDVCAQGEVAGEGGGARGGVVVDARALLLEGTGKAEAGELGKALDLLRKAVEHATEDAVRHRSLFNLGSVLQRRGESAAAEDPERAVASLRLAESRYLGCLEIDPGDLEAAQNIEHIRARIDELTRPDEKDQEQQQQQEQEQQEQEAGDGEGDGEDQPGQQEGGDERGEESGSQGQSSDQQQQGQQQQGQQQQQGRVQQSQQQQQQEGAGQGQQPRSAAERLEELARRQEEETARTRERGSSGAGESARAQEEIRERTEAEARASRERSPEAAGALDRAAEEQRRAEEALVRGDTGAAQEHQRSATDALRAAQDELVRGMLEEMLRGAAPQEVAVGEEAEAEPAEEREPVDPLVAQILEQEEALREAREKRGIVRERPEEVEEDW